VGSTQPEWVELRDDRVEEKDCCTRCGTVSSDDSLYSIIGNSGEVLKVTYRILHFHAYYYTGNITYVYAIHACSKKLSSSQVR
jgi:hypothetical protein